MPIEIKKPAPGDTFSSDIGETIPASGKTTSGYKKVAVFCHQGALDPPESVLMQVENGQVQAAVVDVQRTGDWEANAPGVGPGPNVLRVLGIDESNNSLWLSSVDFMVEEPGMDSP